MTTERHTNIAISNWLLNWLNRGVPFLKQSVCDQSLAILSAIVNCPHNIHYYKIMLGHVQVY